MGDRIGDFLTDISIHAPREGSDPTITAPVVFPKEHFNPRSPRGERRRRCKHYPCRYRISIHAPREGSDAFFMLFLDKFIVISIHAPREGSDHRLFLLSLGLRISIHAPREGSDR